jgi:hypothetical protein
MSAYGRHGWPRNRSRRSAKSGRFVGTAFGYSYSAANTRWTVRVSSDYERFRSEREVSKYEQYGCFWNGRPLYCESPGEWAEEDKPWRFYADRCLRD